MELMLKLPRDSQLISRCKDDLIKATIALHADLRFKKVTVVPDVDAL